MVDFNFRHITVCPICGEELVVIDNFNYITMICPECHSTVFEELDNNIHVIKNGIMEDGYDASMDIFYKQLVAYSIYAKSLNRQEYEEFWNEKRLIGLMGEDILADGIYDYFVDKIKNFSMRQPCIYFKGYKKYLEMSKSESEDFKKKYIDKE